MASTTTPPSSTIGKALILLHQLTRRVLTTPASPPAPCSPQHRQGQAQTAASRAASASIATTGNGCSSKLETVAGSNRLYTKAWSRVSLNGTPARNPAADCYATSSRLHTSAQGVHSHEALAEQVSALYQVGSPVDPFNVFPRFRNRRLNTLHLVDASKCTLCSRIVSSVCF